MNLRTLSLTVAVLAALCAVAWFLQRPETPKATDRRIGEPVLKSELPTQAAQIRLADQGKTVQLTRQADGSWIVPSYHDLPADFTKLSQFISTLTEARIQRLVTTRTDRLARLEFKDTTVALLDASGKEFWKVTLGKNADGGDRYLRYGTEEKGYLANLTLWLDSVPKNWANPVLLELKADELSQVEIGFADPSIKPVITTRAKKGDAWSPVEAPAGKRLRIDRVTTLLGNFTSLRFTDTAASDDANATAARASSRMIRLGTFDGKTFTIILGRKPEAKRPKTAAIPANPDADSGVQANPAAPVEPAAGTTETVSAPKEPEFETIPAGPVFAFITSSDAQAPINGQMQKLSYQIGEWIFTALPATPDDLWEDVPASAPAASGDGKSSAEPAKS